MPMVLGLPIDEGNSTLISMGGVGTKDVEVVSRAGVDAVAVGLGRNTGFGGDAEVDLLVIQAPTEFCKSAVAAVLDVVCGEGDGRSRRAGG